MNVSISLLASCCSGSHAVPASWWEGWEEAQHGGRGVLPSLMGAGEALPRDRFLLSSDTNGGPQFS